MAIYHQCQVVRLTAPADLSANEGCFLTAAGALTTASTAPDKVLGVADSVGEAGQPVDILLPGHTGIVGVKLHASSPAVSIGDRLVLAASGAVAKGSSGTLVAVALAAGKGGKLIEARLVEPTALAAPSGN